MQRSALFLVLIAGCLPAVCTAEPARREADVCVYGGTASGVMAAIAAKKEGAKVIIVEPSRWLGGMTGGGLDEIDWGRKEAVGGTAYGLLKDEPGNEVYRRRFKDLVEKHGIEVLYDHRLGRAGAVHVNDRSIQAITLDHAPVDDTGCPIPEPEKPGAARVTADVFIDCTYEGDLMAMSGVTCTWGRESRDQYGESLAGVRPNLWVYDIDPYLEPGNPDSGLIPFVQDLKIGPPGSADQLTMGYCFRYEQDSSGGGFSLAPTEDYDPKQFELYRRAFRNKTDITRHKHMREPGRLTERDYSFYTPNLARGLLTTTVYGCNADYPNGDWATRSQIWKFHQEFLRDLLHFLRTDPAVPAELKRRAEGITLRRGPFDETGGWPSQLYVREARRMVSEYVVTQKDLEGRTDPAHPVGLASYGVDDWPYATCVVDGKVALQGGEFSMLCLDQTGTRGIYKIPYEAIVPRRGECGNLLVPVCCSASHIAMTSIRMEPVWMILGESAGVAAAMATDARVSVQDVPYEALRAKLLELGQKLERPKRAGATASWTREEWDRSKEGYEWVFPLIDENRDGTVSAGEYRAFQAFKKRHDDWEKALRQSGR